MLNFRLTPDAQYDLIEIRRYTLKQWGVPQSQKYLSKLRQTIRFLTETPALGKKRTDIGFNVMSFPYASHAIYYVEHKQQLVVFGVLHRSMVPLNHLTDRELI